MTNASQPLEDLVARALDLLESEGEPALERLCAESPAHATRLRQRIAALRAFGLVAVGGPAAAPPERLGEFRLLEPLGAGGMGIVYRAIQEPLGREVALKVIRPEHLYFPGARERFRREVEIVAKLHHPGIVPIYTVGEENGVPYFAMEFLPGATIATLLERVRGANPRSLLGRDLAPDPADIGYLFVGSWEDACLRIVRQVADAVEHAHRSGVWHRDIKPSNVLVTSDGASRAVLLDFGLAASSSSGSITRSGAQLGSLHYMSPEQVRGATHMLGPRSDVYQLGVTLYEMLALRSAYEGQSDAHVIAAIERGTPRPLRELNPSVSWEAETVCLTALDVDPARRYASAADLARDLGNVLDRRPIEARRVSAWRRAQRWIQRNPARAVAVGLGALLLVGAPTAYAWQQRQASIELAAERDRAERSLGRALEAVDRMLARVGDVDLRFVPQMESVRRALLQDAVLLLETFVAEEVGNARAELAVASAHRRLALLHHDLGRNDEAERFYAKSIAAFERVMRTNPEESAAREAWLGARIERAQSAAGLGRHSEAVLALEALAVDLASEASRTPANLELEKYAVNLRVALGKSLQELGRDEEAHTMLRAAAEASDKLLARPDAGLSTFEAGFQAWDALGYLYLRKYTTEGEGNPEAERVLSRAVELAQQCAERVPREPRYVISLAVTQNNYAGALRRAKRYAEAKPIYEDARDALERVVHDFPDNHSAALQLATTYNQLALLGDYTRDAEYAIPNYVRAVAILKDLVSRAPNEPTLWDRFAQAQANLSEPLRHLKRRAEGETALVGAVAAARRAVELMPDSDEQKSDLVIDCSWLARTRRELGRYEDAARSANDMTTARPEHWKSWSGAAVELARLVAAVQKDKSLSEEERARLTTKFVAEATACLRGAVAHDVPGSRDLHTIQDLAPLFGHEVFEAYAKELVPSKP